MDGTENIVRFALVCFRLVADLDLVVGRQRQDVMERIRWSLAVLYDLHPAAVATALDFVGVLSFEVLVGEGPFAILSEFLRVLTSKLSKFSKAFTYIVSLLQRYCV